MREGVIKRKISYGTRSELGRLAWTPIAAGSRITAFDLEGGKVRWDFRLRNGWSPSPVRPLVCGRRIYIRASMTPDRVGVACLDGKTGRKLWLGDCGGTAASDPLWYRGRLFVLARRAGQRTVRLAAVPRGVASRERRRAFQAADSGDGPARDLARRVPSLLGRQPTDRVPGGKRDRRPTAGANPLAPARTILPPPSIRPSCSSSASRQSSPMDGCSSSSPEAAWSSAWPGKRPASSGGAASWACSGLSICRATGSWRRSARGLVALNKTTGEILWQREYPRRAVGAWLARPPGLSFAPGKRSSPTSRNSCFSGWTPPRGRPGPTVPCRWRKTSRSFSDRSLRGASGPGAASATAFGTIHPRRGTRSGSSNCAAGSQPSPERT